jgi:hypothetical protein
MSAKPLTIDHNVGYVTAEDVYIVFSEYYGDGTIYGRQAMILPDGFLAQGAGKSKSELVAIGCLVSDDVNGALNGDLIIVPVDTPVAEAQPVESQSEETQPIEVQPVEEIPPPPPAEESKPIDEATSLKTIVVTVKGIKVVFNTQITPSSSVIVNVDEVNGTVEFNL